MMDEFQPQHAPLIIYSGTVTDPHVMPFSGDDHIIVAVIAHFARPPGGAGSHRTGDGQSVALTFLAAKAAAHPAHFDPDGRHRHMQGMGHFVLNFRRMLGGRQHHHIAAFLWQTGGDLTFKVEMFLTAHIKTAVNPVRGRGNRRRRIAFGPDHRAGFEA